MTDHIADVGKMVPEEWVTTAMTAYWGDQGNTKSGITAAIVAIAPMIRAAEMERCHEIAFHEHLAATHDDEDDGNTNIVARFKSQGAADGAARIMAAIRAMPKEDA